MPGNNDPWTPFQKSLLAVAGVLGLCCLMAKVLMELRPYMSTRNTASLVAAFNTE